MIGNHNICNFPDTYGHFKLEAKILYSHLPAIVEYRSSLSGIRVIVASLERPLIDSFFVIPTEAKDDNGCAHALEHLIFLGSRKYPFNGTLDALAGRCLAEGTNAWTETDHTTYTITTAGYEGFFNILEVYLDHILHPLLEHEAFLTEIHHVTEKGENNGIVYSEMAAREHDCSTMIDRALKMELYPEGCGYRYETGGCLQNLRNVSLEDIKQFHQQFYRWNNLTLLVVGNFPIIKLLDRIMEIEKGDLDLNKNEFLHNNTNASIKTPPFPIPWTSPILMPSWKGVQHKRINFPTEDVDDDKCEMVVGWRGPDWIQFRERFIVSILGDYLCQGNASPLQKRLKYCAHPLCSDINYDEEPYKASLYCLWFEGLPKRQIGKLFPSFKTIIEEEVNHGIVLERVQGIARRRLASIEQRWEDAPEESFSEPIIEYIVNSCGVPNESLLQSLWDVEKIFYDDLLCQSKEFWTQKLQEYYYTFDFCCEITGIPSQKLAKKHEKKLIRLKAEQLDTIRRESGGITNYKAMLNAAKQKLEYKAPENVISSFPIADVKSVSQYKFPCYMNFDNNFIIDPSQNDTLTTKDYNDNSQWQNNLNNVNIPLHFCDVPSKFFELRVFFRLPSNNVDIVPLLLDLLFEVGCNIKKLTGNNEPEYIDHEAFTNILLEHTINYHALLGLDGSSPTNVIHPELVSINICCQQSKIAEALKILHIIFEDLQFTEERIVYVAKAYRSNLLRALRKSKTLCETYHLTTRYHQTSFRMQMSLVTQLRLLRHVVKNPKDYLIKLQHQYSLIFGLTTRMCLMQIVGSKSVFEASKDVWSLLPSLSPNTLSTFKNPNSQLFSSIPKLLSLSNSSCDMNRNETPLPYGNALVFSCLTKDADSMIVSIPSALGYNHLDAASLNVLSELLEIGPLFTLVRGTGTAYTVSCFNSLYTGEFFLKIFSATDLPVAFAQSLNVFKSFFNDDTCVDELLTKSIDSAKCSALFHLIREEATMSEFAAEQLYQLCLGLRPDHSTLFLNKIGKVTVNDLRKVARQYLGNFLEHGISKDSYSGQKAIVCVTPHVNDLIEKFKSLGCWSLNKTDEITSLTFVEKKDIESWMLGNQYLDTNNQTANDDSTSFSSSMSDGDYNDSDSSDSN